MLKGPRHELFLDIIHLFIDDRRLYLAYYDLRYNMSKYLSNQSINFLGLIHRGLKPGFARSPWILLGKSCNRLISLWRTNALKNNFARILLVLNQIAFRQMLHCCPIKVRLGEHELAIFLWAFFLSWEGKGHY